MPQLLLLLAQISVGELTETLKLKQVGDSIGIMHNVHFSKVGFCTKTFDALSL
jgi:hypothetical protein